MVVRSRFDTASRPSFLFGFARREVLIEEDTIEFHNVTGSKGKDEILFETSKQLRNAKFEHKKVSSELETLNIKLAKSIIACKENKELKLQVCELRTKNKLDDKEKNFLKSKNVELQKRY